VTLLLQGGCGIAAASGILPIVALQTDCVTIVAFVVEALRLVAFALRLVEDCSNVQDG
jgi:hypothetical protein